MQESWGAGRERPPHGAFCFHASILSGKQQEGKAACPMGSAILPPHSAASNHRFGVAWAHHPISTTRHPPTFILWAPSTSAGCCPKVHSPAKQLLSVTAPLGRSRGEEVFVQAGVTAIACYRPRTLLGWQELRSPAITQHQSFPGKVAADNGGFMDFGGDFVSGNLRGLCCWETLEACCAH